ncbi:MAG: hypothetical protein RB292_05025 [Patescibacteria group bacterium]|jgi:hypothetical protein|nr:hypothetical protein [Patescibacteria group bacterium]
MPSANYQGNKLKCGSAIYLDTAWGRSFLQKVETTPEVVAIKLGPILPFKKNRQLDYLVEQAFGYLKILVFGAGFRQEISLFCSCLPEAARNLGLEIR